MTNTGNQERHRRHRNIRGDFWPGTLPACHKEPTWTGPYFGQFRVSAVLECSQRTSPE